MKCGRLYVDCFCVTFFFSFSSSDRLMHVSGMKFNTFDVTYLHPDNRVNKEQHRNQQANVRQRLEWLYEGPEQDTDCVSLTQQFDQSSRSEESQKSNVEVEVRLKERKNLIVRILICKKYQSPHLPQTLLLRRQWYFRSLW